MRAFTGLLLLLLPAVPYVLAETTAEILATVPNCGLVCLEEALTTSACAATNTTCVCADDVLQANVTLCVTETCTIKESLLVKNATSTLCNVPIRDKTSLYNTVSNTMGTIAGVVILFRFVSKFMWHMDITADDYFVLAAFISGLPSTVLTVHGLTSNGLGRDIWTVTPTQITSFIHVFYSTEILYFSQVALLKLSLCAFYLRIFPGQMIKKVIYATMLFNILFGTAFVLVGIFQCQPISFYWKSWDQEHKGKCINVNVLGWSNAVISIVLDIWMLGIPISQLLALQLHWKKKVSVGLMFMVGTFVTVISVIRLQALVHFANSQNPTWDNLEVGIWSTIEIDVGIICVSMPNLRLILVRLSPKVFGNSTLRNTSRKEYISNGNHSQTGGHVTTNRARNFSRGNEPVPKGIVMSKSYTVQYPEEDELELTSIGNSGKPPSVTARSF